MTTLDRTELTLEAGRLTLATPSERRRGVLDLAARTTPREAKWALREAAGPTLRRVLTATLALTRLA